ncbi:hypothetical protein [Parasutterella excrementihominis]|uniref:hypothetical protein n=1 Tax=Parasutterella excrementihominis TaxID=487175 RepID=UPI00242DB918|nr:hypothetical protein [Parasutterella excrementihominis]
MDDCFLGVLYRCAGLEKVSMTGCCLYCKFAESYWVDKAGKRHVPPVFSFGDMHIWCHQPKKGGGIECYAISFTRCSVFERDTDERIERRRAFFSQFDRYRVHAELIAQRR